MAFFIYLKMEQKFFTRKKNIDLGILQARKENDKAQKVSSGSFYFSLFFRLCAK